MAKTKKEGVRDGFILHYEHLDKMECLSAEDFKSLILLIREYIKTENKELAKRENIDVMALFFEILPRINYDINKYKETCSKNRENANKRWQNQQQEHPQKPTRRGRPPKARQTSAQVTIAEQQEQQQPNLYPIKFQGMNIYINNVAQLTEYIPDKVHRNTERFDLWILLLAIKRYSEGLNKDKGSYGNYDSVINRKDAPQMFANMMQRYGIKNNSTI